jgi:2-methylisocitrate lyase-like PEP mutase family enzyme
VKTKDFSLNRSFGRASRRGFMRGAGILAGGVLSSAVAPASATATEPNPQQSAAASSPGARFRELMGRPDGNFCPGVGNVATAKIAAKRGFRVIMTGGSALSQSDFGFGDWGLFTLNDMVDFVDRVTDAVDTPILVDADDCFGNPLIVYRTVQRLEKVGAACISVEDLYGAKHLSKDMEGKILAVDLMVDKVHAALDARRNPDTVILVRTDALTTGASLNEALDRIAAYAEAGGEMIFVVGIPLDQCPRAARLTNRPILAMNTTPDVARKNGVSMIYTGALGSEAMAAADRAALELMQTGRVQPSNVSGGNRVQIADTDTMVERAKKYRALRYPG